MQAHRPGSYKQSNKAHKSKFNSKRSVAAASKGKVNVKEFTKRNRHILRKEERRHQSLQIRRNKREEVFAKKRALGGSRNPPFLTCIVPLNIQLDTNTALGILLSCSEGSVVTKSENGISHVSLPNFKQRFSFVCPEVGNDFATVDALKIADTVLFIVSAVDDPIDEWGERVLALAMAQGMPTPIVALMDMESLNPKKRTLGKQNIQKLISKWLPDEKVFQFDKDSDGLNLFRRIGNQKRRVLHHRERRPHMLSENTEYILGPDGATGTLKVSGYIRGMPLSVNGLVHISGLGDFQMSQIDSLDDPHPLENSRIGRTNGIDEEMCKISVLQVADPAKQESLISENIPDLMDAEQTWPTQQEIDVANIETKIKKIKKVPKGMSDYQAAWIVESEEEGSDLSDIDEEDEDENEFMSCEDENSDPEESEEEDRDFESVAESEMGVTDERYDQMIDAFEEHDVLEKLRQAREQQQFPDEMDTPEDIPARERFQKYRGLESFRTSPWDPKENLPQDYARIFQFQNYERTRQRIFKENEEKLTRMDGHYITIHIKDVPQEKWNGYLSTAGKNAALTVFGLLPHEHKMSVVSVVLKRTGASEDPIKSKERLIFQCGYRRFIVNPVFSQHTNGSKHKYERFFQPASTCVATFYAPIQFSPSSVLCFKEKKNSDLQLVATGVLLSCNPDRLIIKRIVLSGHPYKVNKKSAVIRFMFFNRDDVLYYKPCKLRTKLGRTGHIKEPLGTHGHMKCVFDGQLKSQDTVLLSLFKRIYPKWTYEECIVTTGSWKNEDGMQE